MADYSLTKDILFDSAKTAWDEFSFNILGSVAGIQWPNVERATPFSVEEFWLQVNTITLEERPRSLKNSEGVICFETTGILTLAIVCPKSEAGLTKGTLLAEQMKNFYKAVRIDNLKFKNSQIQESQPQESVYTLYVNVNYEHFFTLQLN